MIGLLISSLHDKTITWYIIYKQIFLRAWGILDLWNYFIYFFKVPFKRHYLKDETVVPSIFIEEKVHLSRNLEVDGIQCFTIDCRKDEKLDKCAKGITFLNNISSSNFYKVKLALRLLVMFVHQWNIQIILVINIMFQLPLA